MNDCPFCYLNRGGLIDDALSMLYEPCVSHGPARTFTFDGDTWTCTKNSLVSIAENILFRKRSRTARR